VLGHFPIQRFHRQRSRFMVIAAMAITFTHELKTTG